MGVSPAIRLERERQPNVFCMVPGWRGPTTAEKIVRLAQCTARNAEPEQGAVNEPY